MTALKLWGLLVVLGVMVVLLFESVDSVRRLEGQVGSWPRS